MSADEAEATLSTGEPAAVGLPTSAGGDLPPLRDVVVDLAFLPAGRERAQLDDFLSEPDWAIALILWFGHGALSAPLRSRRRLLLAIDRDIAWLDELLTAQVNAILHHARFQRLEAGWRGIQYLVTQSEISESIKIRVLNISWQELCREIDRAIEFDQGQLFHKVYNEEFGMPGGEPFGVLIGDYEIQHRRTQEHLTDDIAALQGMSGVAAAAFAPFIVGCSPAFLGLDSFRELGVPIDLRAVFRLPEYTRWRSLQDTDDSRFIGVTLPRVLMRLPYRDDGSRIDGFRFRETVEDPDQRGHLWGNAAFAFGGVLIRAYSASAWFADVRGTPQDDPGGGIVPNLPVEWFNTDKPGIAIRYSTDVSISEYQERELSELGLLPLSKVKNTDYSAFYSSQSVQNPKIYTTLVASVNARLSSMLQYIVCVSRFAHYLKILGRERVGSFATADECQRYLQKWLANYVTGSDAVPMEVKARYPLRSAQVQVRELPGKPGSYLATAHLQPHFQFDQIVSAFKLVTELAPTRAA